MILHKPCKKRILVTGLNGVTGWNLFLHARNHYDACGTYRKRHRLLTADYLHRTDLDETESIDELLRTVRPEIIIHYRGMCDLDMCELFPDMVWKINVEGTRKLIESVERLGGVEKFVYMSTDHVFNGDTGDYTESMPPEPKHVYGKTKLACERIVQKSKLPYLIIRPGMVIGDSCQGNKGSKDFLLNRIRAGKPTHLFTDEFRTPIRADEMTKKIFKLIENGETGIVHITGDSVYSRYELGRKLAEDAGLSTEYIFPKLREEDEWAHIRPCHLTLKSERLKEKLLFD